LFQIELKKLQSFFKLLQRLSRQKMSEIAGCTSRAPTNKHSFTLALKVVTSTQQVTTIPLLLWKWDNAYQGSIILSLSCGQGCIAKKRRGKLLIKRKTCRTTVVIA